MIQFFPSFYPHMLHGYLYWKQHAPAYSYHTRVHAACYQDAHVTERVIEFRTLQTLHALTAVLAQMMHLRVLGPGPSINDSMGTKCASGYSPQQTIGAVVLADVLRKTMSKDPAS